MKHCALLICILSPLASAQIYKCVEANGQLGFSDKPCSSTAKQQIIVKKPVGWLARLKQDKSSMIEFINVERVDDATIIDVYYETTNDMSEFMRLVAKLSEMSVLMQKITGPSNGQRATATIKVSPQSPSLFDE